MNSEQEAISARRVSYGTYPVCAPVIHSPSSFVRQGLLEQSNPQLELQSMYQPNPFLQQTYFNYAENPVPYMVPTLPAVPAFPAMQVVEEERIQVGVEETDPRGFIVANTTQGNHVALHPQLELRLRINQQLQEYHGQLTRLHEDLLRKRQEGNWSVFNLDSAQAHTPQSIDQLMHLPAVTDQNRPYYAYLQHTLIKEEPQRSMTSGDQMPNINRKLELKSSYQIHNVQEKGLQTDLPEQYNVNQYNNTLHVQMTQNATHHNPPNLVAYNAPQRPLAPVQHYMYENYDEPLNLTMPKKENWPEWGMAIQPPPAHNNPASTPEIGGTYLF